MINQINGFVKPTAHIEGLCDVVFNKRRNESDFKALLDCLEKMPKECIPFKKKILQHIHLHAIENDKISLKLASKCFAKATLLYRKSTNKDEGPVGVWKTGFLGELVNIETNLNQLYDLVGVSVNKLLENINEDEYNDIDSSDRPGQQKSSFETVINRHLRKINISIHNLCCLISVKTDYDLPMPVVILMRLASKLCLLRWKDYKKRPNSIMKEYIYSLTPQYVGLGLMIFNCLCSTLGSRIIPYTPLINQTVINLFEWSRASNLLQHNERAYHSIRSHLFNSVGAFLMQLSLNLNLDPLTLEKLIKVEIVENLEAMMKAPSNEPHLRDAHQVDALRCLENLFASYSSYLDGQMESVVKSHIIDACINIYRDFGSNTLSLAYRRQLLQLLQIIASQPFATSATEIACNIFELAEKVETDASIKSIITQSLRIGLAHRPTIVSHTNVYNIYGRSMINLSATNDQPMLPETVEESSKELGPESTIEITMNPEPEPSEVVVEPEPRPTIVEEPAHASTTNPTQVEVTNEPTLVELEGSSKAQESDEVSTSDSPIDRSGYGKNEVAGVELALPEDAENMVDSFMSQFVDKLA